MTKQNIPWDRLAKYFAGELTKDEEAEMVSWIKADREREQKVLKLRRIWKESGFLPYQLNVDEAWELLSVSMEKLDLKKQSEARKAAEIRLNSGHKGKVIQFHDERKFSRSRQTLKSIAFTVAAVSLIVAGLFSFYNESLFEDEANEVVLREYETGEGERAAYVLSDGSRVVLHAESKLEVPGNFSESERELRLEGEAWFEVAHDPEKPFTVHSGHSQARVLGTQFLIQSWSGDAGEVEVVVAEGKVAFGAGGLEETPDEVIISENQRAIRSAGGIPVVSDVEDLNWYLGWTEGRLVFHNRSLNEIIPKLERWYVLDIQVDDSSTGEKKLSAEIDYSQPMTEVLESIALALHLEVEREGRLVTFREMNE